MGFFGGPNAFKELNKLANYNTYRSYNKKLSNGGANYNSSPFVVFVLDNGYGLDSLSSLFSSLSISDSATGQDSIALAANINTLDLATGLDFSSISPTIGVSDSAIGQDAISIGANISASDSGIGRDAVAIAGAFYVIDSNNLLQPLGVLVQQDSRFELLPSTRDNVEEIPGAHGEFDFGTEFKARSLEIHVATEEGYAPLEKAQLQRLFAKYLDPTKGPKTLIFADDVEKTYVVKFSGKIDPKIFPSWFEFTIPFKMNSPFIQGSFEKVLTGSGILMNEGTFETYLTVEISGPATNPSLNIGDKTLYYSGTISAGQSLVINTKTCTARIGADNALAGYNGVFPSLPPGETPVTAGSNVTIRWRDCWL